MTGSLNRKSVLLMYETSNLNKLFLASLGKAVTSYCRPRTMNWVAGSAAELQQYLNRDYRASHNRLADSLEYFTQQDCSNLFEAEYTSPADFRAPELIFTLLAQPPTVSRSKAGELKRLYGQEGECLLTIRQQIKAHRSCKSPCWLSEGTQGSRPCR